MAQTPIEILAEDHGCLQESDFLPIRKAPVFLIYLRIIYSAHFILKYNLSWLHTLSSSTFFLIKIKRRLQ